MTFQHNSNLDISLKLTGVMSNMGADIFMIVIVIAFAFVIVAYGIYRYLSK